MSRKIHYPKWIYHKTEAPRIVKSKEEHDQAGKGWKETPFAEDKEQISKTNEQTASKNEAFKNATNKIVKVIKEKIFRIKG